MRKSSPVLAKFECSLLYFRDSRGNTEVILCSRFESLPDSTFLRLLAADALRPCCAPRLPDQCRLTACCDGAGQDKKTDDLKPADPDTGESTVEESTLGLLPYPFEKRGVSPCSQPSSTAMRLVPAQKTRNCVTGTVSISASTIRRWC